MSKKYILIQNDGEIETNSFELIGASTKRGETGKIGFFGSGLKYSIAYMMRKGIDFRVFSGESELIFTTTPETLKEQTFDRICINGKPTSYTVTMGPTWTEDWFVLRELYCNALDESNCQMVKETENINSAAGKTRIYVELTKTLKDVVAGWDSYFSSDREPLFESGEIYTSYLSSSDIGGINSQKIKVFSKTKGILFRKGINVAEKSKQLYDYGIEHCAINEDRTAKHTSAMPYIFTGLIATLPDENYVLNILRSGSDDDPCEEYISLQHNHSHDSFSEKWVQLSREYMFVIKERSGKYSEVLSRTKKEILYIPSYFARDMKKKLPEVSILGMGKAIGDVSMSDVEVTPKMDFLLKEVKKSLLDMKYDVPFDIEIVQFNDDHTLGQADPEEKKIYLSDKLFDMGRREIALTLMEETEHIASKCEDETRAFQNHLISQWLTSMENQNGLFL